MNSYTLMPLHSYNVKIAGIILSVISIVLMVIVSYVENFSLIRGFDHADQFNLFLWTNGAALFLIAFSREKVEDERISLIRDKTYRVTLGGLFATLLAFSFVSVVFHLKPVNAGEIFPFLINFFLIYHLVVFYYRIYFNAEISTEEVTVLQNIRKNKKLFIIYLAVNIIAALLLLFL